MSAHNDKALKLISESHFDGMGQGEIRLQVQRSGDDYLLSAMRECDVDESWDFLMRNGAEVDIDVAYENFKTLLWRSGVWFLEAWINWINSRLNSCRIQRDGQTGWVRYTVHSVESSPFLDPEANSPIAVIDSHFAQALYEDRPRPSNPDWIIEPWAAVFLHDAGCLSCLPETSDQYFFMLDLLPSLVEQSKGIPIDQGDFLGALHAVYRPPVFQFEFLKDWGPTFE